MKAGTGLVCGTQNWIQALYTVPSVRADQKACFYCAAAMVPCGSLTAAGGMASAALHPGINPLQAFPSLIADMDRLSAGIVVAGLAASLFGTISAVSIGAATLLMKDFFEPLFNTERDERISEERRLGKDCVCTCRSLLSPFL